MYSRALGRSPRRSGRAVSARMLNLLSSVGPPPELEVRDDQPDPRYVRSLYENTRQWYTTAETKAQLLLTVNGAFITIVFSTLFSTGNEVRSGIVHFGTDTRIFLGISAAALASAIACAGLCLWSLHGKGNQELTALGINPSDPDTYKPAGLWYFGHIARLEPDIAVRVICGADKGFETEALAHNAVDLARKVFRKHRWVNAGWALTALALITFAAAGISFFLQIQY